MLSTSKQIKLSDFEKETGWLFKPEGACKGDVCIPLSDDLKTDSVDIEALGDAMGLPVVKADSTDLWAIGPESQGSRALTSAEAPNLTLPDLDGNLFELNSLRGEKVLLYAWAPY